MQTLSLMVAKQAQYINIRNYRTDVPNDLSTVIDLCRKCGSDKERCNIYAICKLLASREHKMRHDNTDTT